jgi:hypothetical protein
VGPKGKIKMIVQFTSTDSPEIYGLAFGVLNNEGKIDDATINNNKDRNKILTTVATIIYDFTARHPNKFIFFCGSTPQRTRLYRMALTLNFEQLKRTFIYMEYKNI